MSIGLDDLINEIESSVGLDEDDTPEDLSLNTDYACTCGADAIRILKTRIARQQMTEEVIKDVATEFFYSWRNSPSTNAADGFDDWWKLNRSRFVGS